MRSLVQDAKSFFVTEKIPDWLFNRNNSFSIPTSEDRFISHLEELDPRMKSHKLRDLPDIKRGEVYIHDKRQVENYCKFKNINYYHINMSIMKQIFSELGRLRGNNKTISVEEAMDLLPKDTSSCYPEYSKKGEETVMEKTKELVSEIFDKADEGILKCYKHMLKLPTTVFHRFSPKLVFGKDGKIDKVNKIRQVWGVPFAISIIETLLFENAISVLQHIKFFSYSLTRPEISIQVQNLRNKAHMKGLKVIQGDVSLIDSHHPIYSHFILFSCFFNLTKLNAKEIRVAIALLLYHFFTPVCWMSRRLSYTSGGNKSGTRFTSIHNSIYLYIILHYFWIEKYGELPKIFDFYILGDDFIMIGEDTDIERLKRVFSLFNLKLSVAKTRVSEPNDDLLYLGFYWNSNNEPDQTDLWWLAKTCFPERYVETTGWGRILSRVASIVFQMSSGHLIFKYLCAGKLKRYLRNVAKRERVIIEFYEPQGEVSYATLPLDLLIEKGWRLF
jgi:hypothetical protein